MAALARFWRWFWQALRLSVPVVVMVWTMPAFSQANQPGNSTPQELLVGVSRTSLSLPLFVAEERGHFKNASVMVRLVDCGSGKRCLQEMLEGRVHAALAAEFPLSLAIGKKEPVVVLASVSAAVRDNLIITRKSSGIRTIRDLAGHRVGVVAGTSAHYQLDSALLMTSTDPKRVSIVDLPAPTLMQAMEVGRADAVCLWQPWAHQLARQLGTDAVVLATPQSQAGFFNLATSRAYQSTRAPDLQRLLAALAKAMDDIEAHPSDAQAVLMRRLEVDTDYVKATWSDFRYALTLSQPLVTSLEGQRRWALRERYLASDMDVNVLDFIDVGPLSRVRPQAVSLAR